MHDVLTSRWARPGRVRTDCVCRSGCLCCSGSPGIASCHTAPWRPAGHTARSLGNQSSVMKTRSSINQAKCAKESGTALYREGESSILHCIASANSVRRSYSWVSKNNSLATKVIRCYAMLCVLQVTTHRLCKMNFLIHQTRWFFLAAW